MFEGRINFGVMLYPQHFYNKSYAKSCYQQAKKIMLVFDPNQNQ